jgi:hypothetical protein
MVASGIENDQRNLREISLATSQGRPCLLGGLRLSAVDHEIAQGPGAAR